MVWLLDLFLALFRAEDVDEDQIFSFEKVFAFASKAAIDLTCKCATLDAIPFKKKVEVNNRNHALKN